MMEHFMKGISNGTVSSQAVYVEVLYLCRVTNIRVIAETFNRCSRGALVGSKLRHGVTESAKGDESRVLLVDYRQREGGGGGGCPVSLQFSVIGRRWTG